MPNNLINAGSNGALGSGLLRAALAQGNNSSSHSPSPPEHVRHSSSSEMTPTPSQVMSHLMGVLNNNGMGSTMMPNDLDLNLDSLQGGFEDCNVDEVIKHELNMDGSLDFNLQPTTYNLQQQQQQQQQPQYQIGLQQQHHHYLQQHHLLNHHLQQPVNNSSEFSNLGHFTTSATTVQTQSGSLAPSAVSSQPPPLCSLAALAPGRSWVR